MVSGDEATEWLPVAITALIGYFAVKTFGGVQNTVDRVTDAPLSVVETGAEGVSDAIDAGLNIPETVFGGIDAGLSGSGSFVGDVVGGTGDFVAGGIGDTVKSGTDFVGDTVDKVTSWKFTGF